MDLRKHLAAAIIGLLAALALIPMAIAAASQDGGSGRIPAHVTDGLGRRAAGGRPAPIPGDERGIPLAVWRNGACRDVKVPIVRTISPDGAEVVTTDVNGAVDAQVGPVDAGRERNPTPAEAADCQRRMPATPAPRPWPAP